MTFTHPHVIPFPGRASAPTESPVSVMVLAVDPHQAQQLAFDVQATGAPCRIVHTIDTALQALAQQSSDVCLVGQLASGESAAGLASQISQRGWSTQLVCLLPAPASDLPTYLPATAGVELLASPYTPLMLTHAISAAMQRSKLHGENRRLKRQLINRNLRDMVGHSPAMQVLRQQVQQAAEAAGGVLLLGEAGTGVDVVAQAIHDSSRRAHRPFIKIDCSVLSAEVLEEELCGLIEQTPHGAPLRQPGRLELADGGTLLLDHANCIALPLQRRLTQMIHEGRFDHPQNNERVRFDVRIVLSAHVDLDDLMERGLFRRELYAEVGAGRIELPTLRSRKEDIGLLTEHFLRRVAAREGRPPRSITLEALRLLQDYSWSGNVRELENLIERTCALDWGTKLTASMIEPWLARPTDEDDSEGVAGLTLAEMERKLIEATFVRFAGNREKTAKALQIGIRTLSGKLREYGYPPRGGPGSNLKPWRPESEADLPTILELPAVETKAA